VKAVNLSINLIVEIAVCCIFLQFT
jgi:hypothetical protein